jgi:hypothetical protein
MAAVWPPGVSDGFEVQGFTETLPNAMLRTQMDAGPAKQRRRFSAAVTPIAGSIMVPAAQAALFEAFFRDTLALGALPFEWTHPRTGALRTWRFTEPPQLTPQASGTWWRIAMKLELLP